MMCWSCGSFIYFYNRMKVDFIGRCWPGSQYSWLLYLDILSSFWCEIDLNSDLVLIPSFRKVTIFDNLDVLCVGIKRLLDSYSVSQRFNCKRHLWLISTSKMVLTKYYFGYCQCNFCLWIVPCSSNTTSGINRATAAIWMLFQLMNV
jgi:hypothetical protein